MRSERGALWSSLLLATLIVQPIARAQTAPATPATAAPAAGEDAKSIYEHALSLYALGKYAESAPMFERAFELKPVPALLYNAAQAHRLAGHAERAVTLYESYLRLYGDPARKAEIEAHIAELKSAIEAQKHAATSPPTGADTPTVPPTGANAAMTSSPADATPAATTHETLTASAPPAKKPLVKRPWFWVAVGGGAVVVGAVIIGIAVGTRGHTSPPASFGTVDGN